MFDSGITGGSILLLCLLHCIAILTVWLSISFVSRANTVTTIQTIVVYYTVRTAMTV